MNVNITQQQIGVGASALVELLGLRSTLVPGDLRPQIAVFEVVLNGILSGQFMVVPVMQNKVESQADTGADGAADDEEGSDKVIGPEDFPPRQAN